MLIYRITKKQHADLLGLGGLYSWGRWHEKGNRVIYGSESRSLAAWEKFVHISDINLLPDDLVLMQIEIPDNRIKLINETKLPKGWKGFPYINYTIKIGTDFLRSTENVIMRIPSAVIEKEYNYLINPASDLITECKIKSTIPFAFDKRVFRL